MVVWVARAKRQASGSGESGDPGCGTGGHLPPSGCGGRADSAHQPHHHADAGHGEGHSGHGHGDAHGDGGGGSSGGGDGGSSGCGGGCGGGGGD
jgi:hypothetical protein